MLVLDRLAVREQHVVMRAVALNVMERRVPTALRQVVNQRHLLPVRECADDFDRGRFMSLAVSASASGRFW